MPSPQDLIHVVSTTTGTGDMTVSAVIRNFSDSDAFGTGTTTDVFDYFGWNDDVPGEWERGTGHMSAANTLVRDTVSASSNGGAAVNWSAGTKHFSNDIPAAYQASKPYILQRSSTIEAKSDYSVTGDGATDDATNLQAAVSAAISENKILQLGAGNFKIGSALSINGAVKIKGVGPGKSIITLGGTTINGLSISTTAGIDLSDFAIAAAGSQAAGAGILLSAPGGGNQNYFSRFSNLKFSDLFTALDLDTANHFVVDRCMFLECTDKVIKIANSVTADAGDSLITGCTGQYTGAVSSANVMLYWQSSGGLKVVGNKFFGGYRLLQYDLASGAATGSLVIASNSLENFTDAGILFTAQTTGPILGTLNKIAITANEIGGFGDGTPIKVSASSTPTWLDTLTITGNVLATSIDGTGTAAQTAVDINYANNIAIAGNTVKGYNNVGTAIKLGSNVSNAYAEWTNTYLGFATNVADSSTSVPRTIYRGVTINSNDNPGLVVQSSTAGNASIRMTNTSGGSPGPSFEFFHDSASPAVNDVANSNIGYGRDSSGNQVQYYNFQTLLTNPTAGAYAAQYIMYMAVAGALAQAMAVGPGVQVGAPTGGDLGVGNLNVKGVVRSGQFTVATLPSASAMGAGARAFVTDANATTFLSTVAGGGSNKVPVVSNGTNWLIG